MKQMFADRTALCYDDGYIARGSGVPKASNPHKSEDTKKAWDDGWMDKDGELKRLAID